MALVIENLEEGLDGAKGLAMRLIASVNLDRRTGSIAAVLPTAWFGADLPAGGGRAAGIDPDADVHVALLDAAGRVLARRSVTFRPGSFSSGLFSAGLLYPSMCAADQDATGTIDVELPDRDGVATVELSVAGEVVESYPVGGTPTAAVASTHGSLVESGIGGETLPLRWQVEDAPAAQRYAVQVSSDDGLSWQTVAVGLTEPAFDLPTAGLDTDEVAVRLVAMTGTGTVRVSSETVPLR